MQIGCNTTGMEAGLTVSCDKSGCDYYVVVIKGTFAVDQTGAVALAAKQEALVYADVHFGEPEVTSIRYECDFARFKPRADVLVIGDAHAPHGDPTDRLEVSLEVASIKKQITVFGDRKWEHSFGAYYPSPPMPFVSLPLIYERAFGGSDKSHEQQKFHATELRNPIGVGFHKSATSESIEGSPLPNLENAESPIRDWSDHPAPVGFGVIGRNWHPRIGAAGTYDEKWLKERFPFLPADFEDNYLQSAPPDQQTAFLQGGELVRCVNMTPDQEFRFTLPKGMFRSY